MRALSPFIALIVLVIAGALINPDFLTASNLLNVVTRSAFIAIIAVGATFVIAGGGLDLSVGSMAALDGRRHDPDPEQSRRRRHGHARARHARRHRA